MDLLDTMASMVSKVPQVRWDYQARLVRVTMLIHGCETDSCMAERCITYEPGFDSTLTTISFKGLQAFQESVFSPIHAGLLLTLHSKLASKDKAAYLEPQGSD